MKTNKAILLCASISAGCAIPEFGSAQELTPGITVTATRGQRDWFTTPQAVSVIDESAINTSNVSNVPDLLRNVEGVYIQRTNLGGGSPFMRGLTGKQVLILVDGVRLNNSYYRSGPHQYLNTIDPGSLERIEVVRGPASVLYGSDGLGGVINLHTRRGGVASQNQPGNFSLGINYDSAVAGEDEEGNLGGYAVQLRNTGAQKGFGWNVGGSVKRYDDLRGGSGVGEQVPSGYGEYGADLSVRYTLASQDELHFAVQHLEQSSVPKTSEVTLDGKVKFDYEPQIRTLGYLEYLANNLNFADSARFTLSANRQKEGEEVIATLPIETVEVTEVSTWGADLQLASSSPDGNHRFTYGAELYLDDFTTSKRSFDLALGTVEEIKPGVPDGATYSSLGFYLQDEWRVADRASLIAGARFSAYEAGGELDHPTEGLTQLDLETDDLSFSVQGVYSLTDQINLVGGVSQGFRAPNMEDFFGRVDFTSEIPNTSLVPEESINYEVGLKRQTASSHANIALFYTDYTNLISRIDTQDALGQSVKQRRNVDSAEIRGIEAGFSHNFAERWSLNGNIAWIRGRDNEDQPLRRIPPLNGFLQLQHTVSERWWWQLEASLARRQDELSSGDISDKRIPPGGTPGYGILSVRAGYERANSNGFFLTLENLFDKRYKTHGSGIYGAGRSLVISYRTQFGQ